MIHLDTRISMVASIALLASCAVTESNITSQERDGPIALCNISDSELEAVRSNALDLLISDWPVLDRTCEAFSNNVRMTPDRICLIAGGPVVKEGCEEPSHAGYRVAFNPETLKAYHIYWITN